MRAPLLVIVLPSLSPHMYSQAPETSTQSGRKSRNARLISLSKPAASSQCSLEPVAIISSPALARCRSLTPPKRKQRYFTQTPRPSSARVFPRIRLRAPFSVKTFCVVITRSRNLLREAAVGEGAERIAISSLYPIASRCGRK